MRAIGKSSGKSSAVELMKLSESLGGAAPSAWANALKKQQFLNDGDGIRERRAIHSFRTPFTPQKLDRKPARRKHACFCSAWTAAGSDDELFSFSTRYRDDYLGVGRYGIDNRNDVGTRRTEGRDGIGTRIASLFSFARPPLTDRVPSCRTNRGNESFVVCRAATKEEM